LWQQIKQIAQNPIFLEDLPNFTVIFLSMFTPKVYALMLVVGAIGSLPALERQHSTILEDEN
jgi:hypothetical protein